MASKRVPPPNNPLSIKRREIPKHLQRFVVEQDDSLYTPMDHASWRFIMKISREFFRDRAHPRYLKGLEETGIDVERIPLISEMDAKLSKFGWGAVAVSGFIPPASFMEFLSQSILPIACDMRQIDHLAYTPAPDIVHEAAGHAPIIADVEYGDYLRQYGEIARKAIYTKDDMAVYLAVRNLSIVKEEPSSTPADVLKAQERLDSAVANTGYMSELALLARMNWWTVEYGLIGSLENPKIYGAGLLSSVYESFHCFDSSVKKVPLDVKCVDVGYDITKPQPQLFVTPDFKHLSRVLEDFAKTMAFRTGGFGALEKALKAEETVTVTLETGISISGTLVEFQTEKDNDENLVFIRFKGPTQLSKDGVQLKGHGTEYHREGFSSPLGKILKESADTIEFASGFVLRGKEIPSDHAGLIRKFEDCTIQFGTEIFFKPEWGVFDLITGSRAVSVHGGPGDSDLFSDKYDHIGGKQKTNRTEVNAKLNQIYGEIRELRQRMKTMGSSEMATLMELQKKASENYPMDWLSQYEILELVNPLKEMASLAKRAKDQLEKIAMQDTSTAEMIKRGLQALR